MNRLQQFILLMTMLFVLPGSLVQAGIDPAVVQKLLADDKAAGDGFGARVSVDGDTAVIGAYGADPDGFSYAGAAYVFTRSNGIWTQQAKLTANDKAAEDVFGISVSVDGNTAVIGAALSDTDGVSNAGAAYVFTRSGTSWTQQAKLTADDKASDDWFGRSVSVSGDTAVIGAFKTVPDISSSVYVFTRSGTSWTQQAKLTPIDKAAEDLFGCSVAVDGDTAVIGAAWAAPEGLIYAGAAYVFTRSGTSWIQQAKLTADDKAASYDSLGWSVSVDGDTAVIGAALSDTDGLEDAGAAYVFSRSGTSWTQQAKLTADDKAADDQFGSSVSVSGATTVIGAYGADQDGPGAAYVFTRSGTSWTQQAKLTADDKAAGDNFGISVSVDGDTAVIGADYADPDSLSDAGAAYIYGSASAKDMPWIRVLLL